MLLQSRCGPTPLCKGSQAAKQPRFGMCITQSDSCQDSMTSHVSDSSLMCAVLCMQLCEQLDGPQARAWALCQFISLMQKGCALTVRSMHALRCELLLPPFMLVLSASRSLRTQQTWCDRNTNAYFHKSRVISPLGAWSCQPF